MRYPSLALSIFLAGCASTVEWEKAGTSRQDMDADARTCASYVQARPSPSRSHGADFLATGPRDARGIPQGATVVPHAGMERDAERQFQEAQRLEACMREKGYRLRRN